MDPIKDKTNTNNENLDLSIESCTLTFAMRRYLEDSLLSANDHYEAVAARTGIRLAKTAKVNERTEKMIWEDAKLRPFSEDMADAMLRYLEDALESSRQSYETKASETGIRLMGEMLDDGRSSMA